MSKRAHILFALALLLLGGGLFAHSFAPRYAEMGIGSPVSPVFYPRILLGLWVLLTLLMLIAAYRREGTDVPVTRSWGRPAAMMIAIALSIWSMRWLGYIGMAPLLAFACGWLLGYRRSLVLALVAILIGVASWWLFDKLLGIPLPRWRLS